MKRLIARPRSLLLVVALTVIAVMCTVSTANAASFASAVPHDPADSSQPCNFVQSLETCQSTDRTVAYYNTAHGDISHCTFVFDVTWGDGGGAAKTLTDPTDNQYLIAEHTYAGPGVYTITVTVRVTAGTCTGINSVHIFTLLKPSPATYGPATTVRAYVAAINAHDYARAWRLGGRNTGQSYPSFVSGFSTTAWDTLTIVSVSGDVVTARLTSQQTDGTVHTYQGTYTVDSGVIIAFDVHQVG